MSSDSMTRRILPRPEPGIPPFPTVPLPERFALDNGLRVLALHRSAFPQIAMRLVIPAGSVADRPDGPGAASLVSGLISEGTEALEGIALHQRIDSLGASLGARAGHDFTEIDLGLLAETLSPGLALLAEVVIRPSFPESEIERIRAESLDALEARLDEPANIADDAVNEAVFGADHPYARLPLGTVESVRALRRASLVDFHEQHYRPNGSILVIAGDLSGVSLRTELEESMGAWAGVSPAVDYPAPSIRCAKAGEVVNVVEAGAAQGEIRVAGPGMARNSADWIPGIVANYVLGGSTITGRLGSNLREKKGWTYGVRSGFAAGVRPSGWSVETAVGAEVTADAVREIRRELQRMVDTEVSADELKRAKDALILSLPRAFETPMRIVSRFATLEAFGLEPDYWSSFADSVRRVTAEQIREIANRYFDPDAMVSVAVGPSIE